MFRAEIDAVPVQETNDVDHRSLHAGVAHACGHDGHALEEGVRAYDPVALPE